ncbi:hypothetical protein Scep_013713 [Stephania cephalantha]|uniref:t-SNARE coiled-coil homology domain-containing protein n=1 Tax=Stephania cephalantha TaxID=152367 RepID=A0AAP0NYP0_9MAGN
MNDLFAGSFSRFKNTTTITNDDDDDRKGVEMSSSSSPPPPSAAMGANLDKFFEDVEGIKDELKEIETVHARLKSTNEQTKTLHNPQSVKTLRLHMDTDVSLALKKAKLIKVRLEALDRGNAATRTVPGCGPGSSSDRTRSSLVASLRQKLRNWMEKFNELRDEIQADYKETVRRRVYAVTGEEAGEEAVEAVIAAGEGEGIVRRALEGGARGDVMEAVREVRERYDAVREVERGMEELRQVFLDMAVMVEVQGEQLDDIESHVARASSFVRSGAAQLETARKHQRNSRKWTCIAIVILLIIVLVVVLPIVLKNRGGGGGGGGGGGTNNAAARPPPSPPTPPT